MTNNPKHASGQSKPPLHLNPPVALIEMAMVMQHGAQKYGAWNWRKSDVVRRIYLDAALRHLFAMIDGQEFDPDSNRLHAAHVMASMAILLDAQSLGRLADDEDTEGMASERMAELTAAVSGRDGAAAAAAIKATNERFDKVKTTYNTEGFSPLGDFFSVNRGAVLNCSVQDGCDNRAVCVAEGQCHYTGTSFENVPIPAGYLPTVRIPDRY